MTAQELHRFNNIMASMQAEGAARGAYFSARIAYAEALGRGDATRKQHQELLSLKGAWEALRNE